MSEGFGWSFYGFWVYAALWVSGYLLWARRANRRESGEKRTPRS